LVVAYGALLTLLGLAWITILRPVDGPTLGAAPAIAIHCRAQLLKYLPSNALHLVGRHVAARRRGCGHGALVFAALAETALMIAGAGSVGLLLLTTHAGERALDLSRHHAIAAMIVGGLLAAVCAAAVVSRARRAAAIRPNRRAVTLGVFRAYLLYLLFFGLNGLLLVLLVGKTVPDVSAEPMALIGLVAAAWVLGFVTPGAPAGLGVREVVLIQGLTFLGLGPMAAPVALAYRLVTTGGDLLCGVAALLLGRRGAGPG
jgi:hypothetical protein